MPAVIDSELAFCLSGAILDGAGDRKMSEAAVKKYVVRLSREERSALKDLISKGKHPAATILKARVLLKADVSEAGEGWSDSRIMKALDTSLATGRAVTPAVGGGRLRRGSDAKAFSEFGPQARL